MGVKRSSLRKQRTTWGIFFISPALIFFVLFNSFPMFNAFYTSLFSYDLITKEFISIKNYVDILTSKLFLKSLLVTGYFVFGAAVATWILAFFLAHLLREKFPFRDLFRAIYFFPNIMSLIAISIIWKVVLQPYGPLNSFFGLKINWLTDTRYAMLGIIFMAVWRGTGYYMVMYLAGLQSIPQEYYEAARIDGANQWRLFRHITIPLMKPVILFIVVIFIIIAIKAFEPMYIMTGGGPNNATKVLTYMIYDTGFKYLKMGKASAMSIVMFVILLFFALMQIRIFKSD
jgi:multiple sugar transport system permease protein